MKDQDERIASPARRHFLAAASAASVRAGAIGVVLLATMSPARAMGQFPPRPEKPDRPSCFLKGTRITTPRGEVKVEDLQIGDLVATAAGALMPVKWVGRRLYKRSSARWQDGVAPIKFLRGAIADGIPRRDLFLSPWHSLLLDGYLIPAKDLVNGRTIVQAAPSDLIIEYYHIVLATHEVVIAEGTLVETLLLRDGEHERFSNFAEYERLYGSTGVAMTPYAARVWYSGGRSHLLALARLTASKLVDVRDPIQKVSEQLASRARGRVA